MRYSVFLLLSVLFFQSCSGPKSPEDVPPNIILIMADDIGIEGFGCYGGTSFRTPNIDRMASQGLRFTHAYSQPLCTPTRVQLMTGKYNNRNWLYFGVLDPEEKTFGHLMSQAGYHTCIAGKWQLYSYDPLDYPGAEKRRGKGMLPKDAGFDKYSLHHSLHTEDKGSRYANPTFLRNGELFRDVQGEYGEDLNVEFMLDFLEKNTDKPVFIYYPMSLPHGPIVPTPISDDWGNEKLHHTWDLKYYPDMVEYMDMLVGRIIDRVEELGIERNTLIMFYSDNGSYQRITSMMGDLSVPGGKGLTTQTGIRVPLIAYWPGRITPGISNILVDASDFLPTLAELSGMELHDDWFTDGISFSNSLQGDSKHEKETAFFWYDPRPGWDKDQFSREIFALNHNYKLFSDGRMFDIRGVLPVETELDTSNLTAEAEEARRLLQEVIKEQMQPPLSDAAISQID